MVKSCCAVGCSNRYSKSRGISFYRFPTDEAKHSKWIAAVRRDNWEPSEHSWLCSAHFVSGKKSDDPLSPDYVPSIFSFVSNPLKRKSQEKLDSYERRKHTKKNQLEHSSGVLEAEELQECDVDVEGIVVESVEKSQVCEEGQRAVDEVVCVESSTMTDISLNYIEALEHVCLSKSVSSSCTCAVQSSASEWSESALKFDNHKVNFYTGLPSFTVLMIVFNFVSSSLHRHSKKFALSSFQEFMLTLMHETTSILV